MRNVFLKIFGTATLTVLTCIMFIQISVSGQDLVEEKNLEEPAQIFWSKHNIEGTWRTVVTQRNCQTGEAIRTFQGILSFHEGGTLTGDSNVMSPALKSSSYGVWKRERGWQQYSFAFFFFRFNSDGTFAGSQKVRQIADLQGENNFTTTGTIEILDPNDNIIATGCATSTGTRFD